MLKKTLSIFSLLCALMTSNAQASVIFTFTIDDLGDLSQNSTIGDTFSFTFLNDKNFASAITSDDISSVSFNSQILGQGEFQSPACGSVCINNLNQFFQFNDLGQGNWQLDLTVGNSGVDAAITIAGASDLPELQLAQNNGPAGFSTFTLQTGVLVNTQFQFINFDTQPHVFSASSISVNEPSVFGILLLSGLVLSMTRKRSR